MENWNDPDTWWGLALALTALAVTMWFVFTR